MFVAEDVRPWPMPQKALILPSAMSISNKTQRQLCLASGNRCAFEGCRELLTADGSAPDDPVILGEMAHIVGQSERGPRGDSPLTRNERDRYDNLILLCSRHHQLIDAKPETYSVAKLKAMKETHETWVRERLGQDRGLEDLPEPFRTDTVYTNLLPIEYLPPRIYGVPCADLPAKQVKEQMSRLHSGETAPFILRGGNLWAFQNLRARDNPFAPLVQRKQVVDFALADWETDDDKRKWLVHLLNRTLNKLTGRRGLHLDHEHHRYYFPPLNTEECADRTVTYTPLRQKQATRKVVWEPKKKSTGEGRGYWLHRAVQLRPIRMTNSAWCLAVRPSYRVTRNGYTPIPADQIGARVTKQVARRHNWEWFGDIQFWRDYLSQSQPRIVLNFGSKAQKLSVLSEFIQSQIAWPGLPDETVREFGNEAYDLDLFSFAEHRELSELTNADATAAEAYDNGDDDDDEDIDELF